MSYLGRYTISGLLGSCGWPVYHACDPRLDPRVANQVLPGRMSSKREARERLGREAIASAALDHPFICKVFKMGAA